MLEYEGLPQVVRALAEKYPAYLCNDGTICHHQKTAAMLEKIAKLNTAHTRYEVDDGSETLWTDLTVVATTALKDGDSVIDAIDYFLDVSLAEISAKDETVQ